MKSSYEVNIINVHKKFIQSLLKIYFKLVKVDMKYIRTSGLS